MRATVCGVVTYRYFDGQSLLIEYRATDTDNPINFYVSGVNYPDEKLLVRTGAGNEYYYLHKDLYSVAGLVDEQGDLLEAYRYGGYGHPAVAYVVPALRGDATGDGCTDLTDIAEVVGSFGWCVGDPAYRPNADFDHNGCVDLFDLAEVMGGYGKCGPSNPFFFGGQRLDEYDTLDLVLYDYKARVYDPLHGRFQQRDPSEFADTYNLYEYAASRPTALSDPLGRQYAIELVGVSGIQLRLAAIVVVGGLAAYQVSDALMDALDAYSFDLTLNVHATELFVAGQQALSEAWFALGGLVVYSSSKGRQRSVEQAEELVNGIETHIAELVKLAAGTGGPLGDPNPILRELEAWLDKIESNLKNMGKNTGKEWLNRLSGWRQRIDELLNQINRGGGGPVGA